MARGTVFQELRPGAGFKTGDFVKEKLEGGYRRTTQDRHNRARQGRAGVVQGRAGSEMRGVLLVPSSPPTLPPIYDDLDVSVTSSITWFHLNHDMLSCRIYKLSFYGGHSITEGVLELSTSPEK